MTEPLHNLTAIIIADAFGLCLTIVLLFGNRWYFKEENVERRSLIVLALSIIVSCVMDAVSFVVDGQPGEIMRALNWISNMELYVMNVVAGMAWLHFFAGHLHVRFTRAWMYFYASVCGATALIILVNLFRPVAFYVDENNIYHRGDLFWTFMVINLSTVVGTLAAWLKARRNGTAVHFVPVREVTIPVVAGIVIQSFCYGVSVIWPAVAIAYGGMLASLQNEMIYRDKLTGLYNRYYLDYLKKSVRFRQSAIFSVIMMDVDDFKLINDRHGHAIGDNALVNMARVLTSAVGTLGAAIRYAGDEFVVVLNTRDMEEAERCLNAIREGLAAWNDDPGHVYRLNVSAGICTSDLAKESVEDMMNRVDTLMYQEKRKHHGEA